MSQNIESLSFQVKEYENTIRRLKVLSKTQTAFLKSYLHNKLSAGAALVSKTLEIISSSDPQNAKLKELKGSLSALKLAEIEVDVNSAQLMMKEEIAMLKAALENSENAPIGSLVKINKTVSSSSASDEKALRALEEENTKLRDLLREAQQEIVNLNSSISSSNPSTTTNKPAETSAKDEEISRLKDRVKGLEKNMSEKEKSSQTEAEKLRKDLAAAESKFKTSNAENEMKLKDLKSQSERQLKELEQRLEAEKEEMMEAMALEVEEIEKTKGEEKAVLVTQIEKLERLCNFYKQTSTKQANALKKLSDVAKQLAKDQSASSTAHRKELTEMGAQIKSFYLPSLLAQLREASELVTKTNLKYRREMLERKRLHNLVQELKGNIRVFMRCRPPTRKETEQFGPDAMCVSFPNPGEVKVYNEKNREKVWEFDEVFDISTKQEQVYEDVSALVTSVLDGFNVCIFAYGQTGSGKTWTMSGPADNRGVNTRALEDLFERARERSAEWSDVIT
eukprot:gene31597-42136_t